MKLIYLLLIAVLLTGCASTQPIDLAIAPIDKPNLILPDADVLALKKIEWVLVTPDNAEEVFDAVMKEGRPIVLFGLTDEGYENLALNFSDIRAYIQQQQAILAAYKRYYLNSVKALDDANSQINKATDTVEEVNKKQEASFWDRFKKK